MSLTFQEISREYILPLRNSVNNMFVEALAWYVLGGDTGPQFTNIAKDKLQDIEKKYPKVTDIGLLSIIAKMEEFANKNEIHTFENNIKLMQRFIKQWVTNKPPTHLNIDSLPDDDMRQRMIELDTHFSAALTQLHEAKKPQEQRRPAAYQTSAPPRPEFVTEIKPQINAEQQQIAQKNQEILHILEARLQTLNRVDHDKGTRKALTSAKDSITGAQHRYDAMKKIVEHIKTNYVGTNAALIDIDKVIKDVRSNLSASDQAKFDKGTKEKTSGIGQLRGNESNFKKMVDEIKQLAMPKTTPTSRPD